MFEETNLYHKLNPFISTMKERYSLSKTGSQKNTQHIVLDLRGSNLTYQVGDSIGIYPTHDPLLINKTIQAMKATGLEIVTDKHTQEPWPLKEYLTRKVNITEISKKLLAEIATLQPNLEKKNFLEHLLSEGQHEAFKNYQLSREIWDVLVENEEITFAPQELVNSLMPLLPRLYSISSAMSEVGEEIHLTVAMLQYSSNNYPRLGVCTHYLCNIVPLHEPVVPVFIQPSHGFGLPDSHEADIIMVGPGTGVAPYRAFMQERMVKKAKGKNWLFFGERNHQYDFFYEDYWNLLIKDNNLRIDTAFSRDQEHKIYVQHRLMEHGAEIYDWLESGSYFYVCGDAHHMAKDVEATLLKIIQVHGNKTEIEAKQYLKVLRQSKRYLRDVY